MKYRTITRTLLLSAAAASFYASCAGAQAPEGPQPEPSSPALPAAAQVAYREAAAESNSVRMMVKCFTENLLRAMSDAAS